MEAEDSLTTKVVDLTINEEDSFSSVEVSHDRSFREAKITIIGTTEDARRAMVNLVNQYITAEDPSVDSVRIDKNKHDSKSNLVGPGQGWASLESVYRSSKLRAKTEGIYFRLCNLETSRLEENYNWLGFRHSESTTTEKILSYYPKSLMIALELSSSRSLTNLTEERPYYDSPSGLTRMQEIKDMIDNHKFGSVVLVGIKAFSKTFVHKESIYADIAKQLGFPGGLPHYTITANKESRSFEVFEIALETSMAKTFKVREELKRKSAPRNPVDEPAKSAKDCNIM